MKKIKTHQLFFAAWPWHIGIKFELLTRTRNKHASAMIFLPVHPLPEHILVFWNVLYCRFKPLCRATEYQQMSTHDRAFPMILIIYAHHRNEMALFDMSLHLECNRLADDCLCCLLLAHAIGHWTCRETSVMSRR